MSSVANAISCFAGAPGVVSPPPPPLLEDERPRRGLGTEVPSQEEGVAPGLVP